MKFLFIRYVQIPYHRFLKLNRWRSEDKINDTDEQWSQELPIKKNSLSMKRSDFDDSDRRGSHEDDRRSRRSASLRDDHRFSILNRLNNSSFVDRHKRSTDDDGSDKRSNFEAPPKIQTSADRVFGSKITRRSFDRDLPPREMSPNTRELQMNHASSSFDSSDRRSEGRRSFSVGSPVRSTCDSDNINAEMNNLSSKYNDKKKNDVKSDKITKSVVKKSRNRLVKKDSRNSELGDNQLSKNNLTTEEGEWACEHCTYLNKETERVCNVCCKTKSSALPSSEFDESSEPPASSKAERAVHRKMSNLKISNSEESGDNSSAKNKGSFRRKISFSFGTKSFKP